MMADVRILEISLDTCRKSSIYTPNILFLVILLTMVHVASLPYVSFIKKI